MIRVSMTGVRRTVAALTAALWLCGGLPAAASINDQIRAQKERIHGTNSSLHDKRVFLHSTEIREDDLRRSLDETQNEIRQTNDRMRELQGQIAVNERKQQWNQVQLAAAKATLERHNQALRRRLVDAYEHGAMGYVEVLFSAHSFSEFVERWDDIRLLIAANERTIRERRAAEKLVAQVQATLVSDGVVLGQQNASAQRTREQLGSLEEQRRNTLAIQDQVRRRTAVVVTELEESSQEQESQLQGLIVERQREEEAALEAARAAARRAAQLAGSSLPVDSNPGAPGDLSWPVSGPITSPFGMRLDPVSGEFTRMHTGIDIGASQGVTIAAAAAGRVIIAGWNDGGYGNMVVIDHGGGLSTLYAHCSQIFVASGQDVQRGQAIAAVGMTGHATGPHLHFEVRINGQPVDPTSRLR